MLACAVQVGTPAPTTPDNTPTPTATPVPTATITPFPAAEDGQTAVVLPVYLVVRQSADGATTDEYLKSGDVVTLTGDCVDSWCPVKAGEIVGWVYQGCLSEVAGDLKCEARP
jgi:SH3-like domain-containing protein